MGVGLAVSVVTCIIWGVVGEEVVSLLSPGGVEDDSLRRTRRGRLNLCLRSRRSFVSFDVGCWGGGVSLFGVGGRGGAGGGVMMMVVGLGERNVDTYTT